MDTCIAFELEADGGYIYSIIPINQNVHHLS